MATPSASEFIDRLPEAFRTWLAGRRIEEVECVIADVAAKQSRPPKAVKDFRRILDDRSVDALVIAWAAALYFFGPKISKATGKSSLFGGPIGQATAWAKS